MKKVYRIFIYISVVVLSIMFIYYGNQYINNKNIHQGTVYDREEELDTIISAQVVSIDKIVTETNDYYDKQIEFTARIFGDKDIKDKTIKCFQSVSDEYNIEEVDIGDKVVVFKYGESNYTFQYFYCLDKICILSIAIAIFILIIGGMKGLNTIISLSFTCMSIFFVYIPALKAGFNIYFSTIIICIYIITMMLLIVYGASKKSLITGLSCSFGVILSGTLSFFMDKSMKLTGYYNNDMFRLKELLGFDIDVKALMFSMITIGALGAIIDVSMSITSPLCEMKNNSDYILFKTLLKSGLNIGKDFIGTMTNTLVLAYIGSSLIMCLIYSASNYPLFNLLNKEEIIIEFLQSLIGCSGILLTIPFTTLIASILLTHKNFLQKTNFIDL